MNPTFQPTLTKPNLALPHPSQALRYIHNKGILHRDIKPENFVLPRNSPHSNRPSADPACSAALAAAFSALLPPPAAPAALPCPPNQQPRALPGAPHAAAAAAAAPVPSSAMRCALQLFPSVLAVLAGKGMGGKGGSVGQGDGVEAQGARQAGPKKAAGPVVQAVKGAGGEMGAEPAAAGPEGAAGRERRGSSSAAGAPAAPCVFLVDMGLAAKLEEGGNTGGVTGLCLGSRRGVWVTERRVERIVLGCISPSHPVTSLRQTEQSSCRWLHVS